MTVPCYLDQAGCPPGSRFRLGPDGLPSPIPGNTHQANFICNIPRSVDSAHPGRVSLYGHGLFGGASEVNSISRGPDRDGAPDRLCARPTGSGCRAATSRTRSRSSRTSRASRRSPTASSRGWSTSSTSGARCSTRGLRRERRVPGRGAVAARHQAALLLGRQPGRHRGRGADGGRPRLHALRADRAGDELQTCCSPAEHRLRPVQALLYPSYPNELQRPLLLSLIQMLWDRGEPNGFAWHMTDDPYPNTPSHTVLLHMAFGDHQVANIGTEVEARTIGAKLRTPALDPGPEHRRAAVLRHRADPPLPVPRQRPRGVGHRADPWARPRHRPAADHEHRPAARAGPARPHRTRAVRPGSVLELHRRRADRRVRRGPCHASGWTGP